MTSILSPGGKASKDVAAKQEELIGRQNQLEAARKAEAEDEIAKRRSLTQGARGGRRSLIRTSELGTAPRPNLG